MKNYYVLKTVMKTGVLEEILLDNEWNKVYSHKPPTHPFNARKRASDFFTFYKPYSSVANSVCKSKDYCRLL